MYDSKLETSTVSRESIEQERENLMKAMQKIGWSIAILPSTLFLGVVIATAASSCGSSCGEKGPQATAATASKNERVVLANRTSRPAAAAAARTAKVVEVSGRDFERYVLKSPVPVLVDFYAHWCGPCRMQAPILDKVAGEIDHARIVKINVDENGALAAAYRVQSIPTLLVFKDGKVIARHTGLAKEERIKMLLSPRAGI